MMKAREKLWMLLFFMIAFLGVATPLQAFQMDVSQVYYSDSVRTINNYDFSTGTKTGDIITIPAGFVNTTDGKTYTYGLFPGTTGMTLAWSPGSFCTLQVPGDANGAAIIGTALPLPDISTAQTAYDYRIKLQNFADMAASGKRYKFDIGLGSDSGVYQVQIKGQLSPSGDLQLHSKAYGANGQDIWVSDVVQLAGMTSLELRIQNTGTGVNYFYNMNGSGWNALGSFTGANGYVATNYKGFPAQFPYAGLSAEDSFQVYSYHQQTTYYAQPYVNDAGQSTYSSVSVASSGQTCGANLPSTALTYNSNWGSWILNSNGVVLRQDGNKPDCFPTYTFTAVKKAGGQDVVAKTVTGYVEQFATNLAPSGNVASAPVFSWTGINGASGYRVEVKDSNWNDVWNLDVASNVTSVPYAGPSLTSGQNYNYFIVSKIRTGEVDNMSMATGSFTYTGATTITVSGYVRDLNGNVINSASGLGPNGVFVCSAADCANKNTFASTETGFFQLAGLPANTPFMLRFYNQDYAVVFSQGLSSASDLTMSVDGFGGITPFLMPTTAQLTALGAKPDAGKAVIMGGLSDGTYRAATVGGAAVTAKGGNGQGKDYPIAYVTPFGVLDGGASSTYPNGKFFVLNVDPADNNIIVTPFKQGWTFNPATMLTVYQPAYPVSVSAVRFVGLASSYGISFGGTVKAMLSQAAIPNVNIALNGNPGKFATSDAEGKFVLNNLPADANFYVRATATGYVPTYVGNISLNGSFLAAPLTMVTAQEMSNTFGVTGSNSLLAGSVRDSQLNPLSGATVAVTSKSGTNYQVGYDAVGGTSTNANGSFFVLNVTPGDVVKIQVTKAGYTFNPYYLNAYEGAMTQKLVIAERTSTLYAKFTNAGIWKYSGSGTDWSQITTSNPQLLVTVGSTLYGTFPGLGIWKFDGTNWNQTTTSVPEIIVGTSSTLYGSFAGLGIWQWNGTSWSQTTPSIPQTIIASTSDLYGTFANLGIWKFNGTNWNQLTTSIPDKLVTSGIKLYGAFSGQGIWLWNGSSWTQATPSNPQLIAASSAKLYGSFAGAGIWSWDGASTWVQISPDTPTQMVASGMELYAVFAGIGIKKWDGTAWSLISGNEPAGMVVGE